MSKYNKKLGRWGEELAEKYYQGKGYKFLTKNWSTREGEIDLIFCKNKDLIFVEVKTRTTTIFGYGEQAVNDRKKEKIKKAIKEYRLKNEKFDDYFPRFDILVVELNNLAPKFI